jgi:hypothetical protein
MKLQRRVAVILIAAAAAVFGVADTASAWAAAPTDVSPVRAARRVRSEFKIFPIRPETISCHIPDGGNPLAAKPFVGRCSTMVADTPGHGGASIVIFTERWRTNRQLSHTWRVRVTATSSIVWVRESGAIAPQDLSPASVEPTHGPFFGTPAPAAVKHAFAYTIRRTTDPRRARGVIRVTTHSDGFLYLWAAPTADHRQCWLVDFTADQRVRRGAPASGSASCDQIPPPASHITWSYGWTLAHRLTRVLSGRVYANAVAVRVFFRRHSTLRLPLVDHYFLAALPQGTPLPRTIHAIDAHGHTVATTRR